MKLQIRKNRSVSDTRGYSLIEVMIVVGISAVVAAIAVPAMGTALGSLRLTGDSRSLQNAVSLTKLRAASDFTKARLYVDLSVNQYHIETWNTTTGAWAADNGVTPLSSSIESYSFGVVGSAPSGTQATIALAPACLTAAGATIANTSCIVFNSRGIPVTDKAGSSGSPTSADALYLTDGTAVFGVTVAATASIQLWRTNPTSTPVWTAQ